MQLGKERRTFLRRHLALVRRGSVDKPASAACFDWVFQRRLMLFVFDKASDLLMDEHKLRTGVISGMQGLRHLLEITFILSNLCAADLWKSVTTIQAGISFISLKLYFFSCNAERPQATFVNNPFSVSYKP